MDINYYDALKAKSTGRGRQGNVRLAYTPGKTAGITADR